MKVNRLSRIDVQLDFKSDAVFIALLMIGVQAVRAALPIPGSAFVMNEQRGGAGVNNLIFRESLRFSCLIQESEEADDVVYFFISQGLAVGWAVACFSQSRASKFYRLEGHIFIGFMKIISANEIRRLGINVGRKISA